MLKIFKTSKNPHKNRLALIKKVEYGHGYSILRSSESLRENEFLNNLSLQHDNYGYMSEELGMELDRLFSDDDYIVGIHRTGYSIVDEEMLNEIFNGGLINNGHIMQGAMSGNLDIENTVSFYTDFPVLVDQLKKSFGYKNSQGSIIIRIPKSYIGKKDGEIKPIYYKTNGIVRLLPEFVYGFVPVDSEGKLGKIIRNPNYSDLHELDNDNLLYDERGISKARREGINLKREELSLNDKYNILETAFIDTLKKYNLHQAEYALKSLIENNTVRFFSGLENRKALKEHIIYGDVYKILRFALNSDENLTKEELIANFINNELQIEKENNITK